MRGHGDLACRHLCADYFACVLKGLNNLHSKVNDHRCFASRREVVNEAIMTVGPETFMMAEKLPDNIKRRLPCSPNVRTTQAAPHCGERLRPDAFGDNVIIHRKFRLYPSIYGGARLGKSVYE